MEYIEGVEVVNKITYLGLEVCDDYDIFKEQKISVVKKTETRACWLRNEVETSFNKLDVGRLWWKCGIMPCLLNGADVLNFTEDQIQQIQVFENRVYRQVLGGLGDTPVAIFGGEVGSSLVRTRVVQARLILAKSILDGDNELLKKILGNIRGSGEGRWNQMLNALLGKCRFKV